ncbi:TonB-dependent hemoglobin/transferrin/lactoferrin family receptor [Pseudotabrizicola sp. 4114]|uniref:TonB-dependent hemoglobin/transferrin/lactoferrin family receptor n=1 Tax=Pseudotabrizicola sp. 4114 TaxID=2817731 RepID=UPI002856862E|nr:hemoglobin/transferrin/lactoferrin receptor protein [Pseudorhodobacter sp. 4114]
MAPPRMRGLLLRSSAALFLTLPLSAPALAQSTPTQTSDVIALDPITVFADRIGRTLRKIQGNITVVDGQELRARNVQSLEDLLRHVPGVTAARQVSGADPFGGQTGVRIRGVEGNRVQMVVDGGRIPERIIDGSRDYLDLSFTRQADIVRGPSSVLWGADALGGLLALETIGPEDLIAEGDTRGGQVTLGYGQLTNSTNVAVAFAQKFGPDLALMVGRSRTVDHEMRLKNARADGGIYGCSRPVAYGGVTCGQFNPLDRTSDRTLVKLDWAVSDSQKLGFSFDHLDRLSETDNRLTLGPATGGATVIDNPRTRDISRTRYALDYEGTFAGPVNEVRATLGWTPSGYTQQALLVQRTAANQTTRQIDYVDYSEDFLELDLQATSRFSLGSSDHVLTFGFDGDRAKTSYDRRRVLTNVTTGETVASVPSGFNFTDGTTRRADLFLQDQITLLDGKLELTPGLRFATYRMDPTLNDSVVAHPSNPTTTRKERKLLGSLGATYHLSDTYSVWAHYGEGFKLPTFQQLYTSSTSGSFDLVPAPGLLPEEVNSVEIGLRGEYDRGFFAVNAFQAEYRNFIESFYFVPGTNDITYRNISAVKTWGVELEAGYDLTDQLKLTGSLAWMDGKAKATPQADRTQHLVPPLTAVMGISYEVPDHDLTLRATTTLARKGKPTIDANFTPPGYGVLDLGASWGVAENAVLNLTVNNVLNKRYFDMATAGLSRAPTVATANTVPLELYTGPARTVALTLDYRF